MIMDPLQLPSPRGILCCEDCAVGKEMHVTLSGKTTENEHDGIAALNIALISEDDRLVLLRAPPCRHG